jgi:hypothetical protein
MAPTTRQAAMAHLRETVFAKPSIRAALDYWGVVSTDVLLRVNEDLVKTAYKVAASGSDADDDSVTTKTLSMMDKFQIMDVIAWYWAQTDPDVNTWMLLTEEIFEDFVEQRALNEWKQNQAKRGTAKPPAESSNVTAPAPAPGAASATETSTLCTPKKVGFQSPSRAFSHFLAETLRDLGWAPSRGEPDVYMRTRTKPCGEKIWEYLFVDSDDLLCVAFKPRDALEEIIKFFSLKPS